MNDEHEQDREESGLGVVQDVGPWQVHMEWPAGADQGGPWYLTVRPNPRATPEDLAGGLSTTVLRQVSFQDAARKWREFSSGRPEDETSTQQLADLTKSLSAILRETAAQGIDETYLAWLSFAYVTLVKVGEKSVTANLAELANRRPETIRAHLKAARTHDLLTTIKGKAGGHLTTKAREIINNSAHKAGAELNG